MASGISYETANKIARVWDKATSLEDAMRRAGLKTKDLRNMNRYRKMTEEKLNITLPPINPKNCTTTPPTSVHLNFDKPKTMAIFSDAHYWPGEATPAHKIFCQIIKDRKPDIIVNNGDSLDFARMSRHDPNMWEQPPSPADELETNKIRLDEIRQASPKSELYWNLGNHDKRLENVMAKEMPQLYDWPGTTISSHFPDWKCQNSIIINKHFQIKHKTNGGGQFPERTYCLNSGFSIAIGHHHRLRVIPLTDFRGTRYAICTGMLGDPFHDAFSYIEDGYRDWQPGFVMVTIDGESLHAEAVHVLDCKAVYGGKTYKA